MDVNSRFRRGYEGREVALYRIDGIIKEINELYNVYATYAELDREFQITVNFGSNYVIEFYIELDEILDEWEESNKKQIIKGIENKYVEDFLLRKGGHGRDEWNWKKDRNHQTAI